MTLNIEEDSQKTAILCSLPLDKPLRVGGSALKPIFASFADPGESTLPDGTDRFWCSQCDEILPVDQFSHVCNLMGALCCKPCNESM